MVAGDAGGSLGWQGGGTQTGHVPPPDQEQSSQGHRGSPSQGTGHLPGGWGWDKAGQGDEPPSGVHVSHQQRTWSAMGIAVQHL